MIYRVEHKPKAFMPWRVVEDTEEARSVAYCYTEQDADRVSKALTTHAPKSTIRWYRAAQ